VVLGGVAERTKKEKRLRGVIRRPRGAKGKLGIDWREWLQPRLVDAPGLLFDSRLLLISARQMYLGKMHSRTKHRLRSELYAVTDAAS
jgi:hypothetical protein